MHSQHPHPSTWHSRLDFETSLSILDSITTLTQTVPAHAEYLRSLNLSLARCNDEDRFRKLSRATSDAFFKTATFLIAREPVLHSSDTIDRGFHNDIDTLKSICTSLHIPVEFPNMHPHLFCRAGKDYKEPVPVTSLGRQVAEALRRMVDTQASGDQHKGGGSAVGCTNGSSHQHGGGTITDTARIGTSTGTVNRKSRLRWLRGRKKPDTSSGLVDLTHATTGRSSMDSLRNLSGTDARNKAQIDSRPKVTRKTLSSLPGVKSSSRWRFWKRSKRSANAGTSTEAVGPDTSSATQSVQSWLEDTYGKETAAPDVLEPPSPIETSRSSLGEATKFLLGSAALGGIAWAASRYMSGHKGEV